MRTLDINKQPIYYALQEGKTPIVDEYGNKTGEYKIQYSEPVAARVYVSAAKGKSIATVFGITERYDRLLITDDVNIPITETSILWVGIDPANAVPHNYTVVQVAESLNNILFSIRKVRVSR